MRCTRRAANPAPCGKKAKMAKITAAQKELLGRINGTPKLYHQIVSTPGEGTILGRLIGLGLVDCIDHPSVMVTLQYAQCPATAYIISKDGEKAL